MVHPNDQESQWLNRIYGRSVERLHSNQFMGFPPAHHQRGEAVAAFHVMKEIARRRSPKSLSKISELERLCLNALDGNISSRQFAHGCKRVAKESRVSNPIADFMDDLVINQSDVRKQAKAPLVNDPWAAINRAFDPVQKKKKGPVQKSAFDFTVPALADLANGGPRKKAQKSPMQNPAWKTKNDAWANLDKAFARTTGPTKTKAHPNASTKNDFWKTKNHAWDIVNPQPGKKQVHHSAKAPRQVDPFAAINKALGSLDHSSRKKPISKPTRAKGSRRAFDPWAVRNPAFETGKKNKPYAHMDKVWKQVLGGK